MVGLGIGIQKMISDSFASMGDLSVLQVTSYKWSEQGGSTETKLTDKSVTAFEKIPYVTAVMPMIETYGNVISGKYYTGLQILGVDAQTAEAFGFALAEGEYPTYRRGSKSYEVAFSPYTLQNFQNPKNWSMAVDKDGNPLVTKDSRFRLTFDWNNVNKGNGASSASEIEGYVPGKIYKADLVGILAEGNYNYAYYNLMAKEAVHQLIKENESFVGKMSSYNQVLIKCDKTENVEYVKQIVEDMGYGTYSMMQMIAEQQKQMATIQYVLAAIGAVSLFVAAIGIMNTMMMSIYERTKEIGIIKVLGCRMWNITMLFLSEAMLIGFFGGLFGLGLSFGVEKLVNTMFSGGEMSGFQVVIPVYLAAGGVAFSMMVALISGLYPALRAMRLSALAAIRNE
jgi:ABC-type antimicrobial peptide transport system permease subunit